MDKLRLMLISETVGGGLRKHIMLLLKYLDPNKYDIIFIHGSRVDETFKEEYQQYSHVSWIEISEFQRELNIKQDSIALKKIYQCIKRSNPDIIHCHSSKAGILGRFAARFAGVNKIFYTPHGYSFQATEFSKKKKSLFVCIEMLASRLATTKTFNVSEGEKSLALSYHLDKDTKFQVIYNGLPDSSEQRENTLHQLLKLSDDTTIYGNCARISSEKDVPLFIKIAQKDLEEYPDDHFVWIGDGDKLEEYQNIHPNIHFIGYRNDADQLVKEFSGMLFTSKHEGLPYALIEALRAGVPIIATNVPGNNEVVIPDVNGFLFDSSDISQAIFLLHHIEQISQKEIRDDFHHRFSIQSMLDQIEMNYQI